MPRSSSISKLLRCVLVACAVGALCAFSSPRTAWAEPTAQELAQEREGLERELAEAQAHLDQLRGEIDEALQKLEESREKLDATIEEAEETREQIEITTQELAEKREKLGVNMRGAYKMGLARMVDTLLGATSFEDLVNRIYYLDKINEAQAEGIQEVNDLAEELSAREQELAEIQERQQADVDAYEAKAVEYEERIEEAQAYRTSLDEDIQEILEEEEAARAAEEAAKRAAEEAAREQEESETSSEQSQNEEKPSSGNNSSGNNSGSSSSSSGGRTVVSYNGQLDSTDADRLIYIQWGGRPSVCWPVQGASNSQKVECGSLTYILAAILLTGDYSITPDSMFAAMEAKYGTISASETYKYVLRYIEEEYGIHHRHVGHLTAGQAQNILAAGHVISAGGGCEGRDGMPFCKEVGRQPRCCHGHVVLFYRYSDGIFWAKDTSSADGAAMCAYPAGPLTVTHRGAAGGRCDHNGQTVSYDNYADAFFRNSWNVELWID